MLVVKKKNSNIREIYNIANKKSFIFSALPKKKNHCQQIGVKDRVFFLKQQFLTIFARHTLLDILMCDILSWVYPGFGHFLASQQEPHPVQSNSRKYVIVQVS